MCPVLGTRIVSQDRVFVNESINKAFFSLDVSLDALSSAHLSCLLYGGGGAVDL